MLKDHTVITLYPEEVIQLNAILLDGDGDEALVFLAPSRRKRMLPASLIAVPSLNWNGAR